MNKSSLHNIYEYSEIILKVNVAGIRSLQVVCIRRCGYGHIKIFQIKDANDSVN